MVTVAAVSVPPEQGIEIFETDRVAGKRRCSFDSDRPAHYCTGRKSCLMSSALRTDVLEQLICTTRINTHIRFIGVPGDPRV